MKKLSAAFIMLLSLLSFDMIQDRTITGTVISADDNSPLPGINIVLKGTTKGTVTDQQGRYKISVPATGGTLVFSFIGLKTKEVSIGAKAVIDVKLETENTQLSEVTVTGAGKKRSKDSSHNKAEAESYAIIVPSHDYHYAPPSEENTEEYAEIAENGFHNPVKDPLSTFSIDVDKASYSNIRRFINLGQRPPKDAVRIEEMINYFSYDYAQPTGADPFSINTAVGTAPWNEKHKLVHIGLQGRIIPTENLPPSNLVFLIDVSGSMDTPNKLPLVKQSLSMLVDQLRAEDRVSMVVYAGAAGVVLEPTPGDEKAKIKAAIERLNAGGSTAGGAGIRLAYDLAIQHYQKNGNNRVILATDGDFNVGESSDDAMETLIVEKRKAGVFLTVLGYGMGNYKDAKMEILADKGNGNYAYIDNITEARKTLVNEFGGTLFTIAKDVKIQVEFNPAFVQAYRLIGYENRMLKSEDFNNDKKDAGELGSGHTVTALYEIIPVGVESSIYKIDELKYQKTTTAAGSATDEMLTVKLRYKNPQEDKSKLLVQTVKDGKASLEKMSMNLKWSAAVAGFGMLLRDSDYAGALTYDEVVQLAQSARGKDEEGYRAEFVNMVKSFGLVSRR
ncbi:MAG TPA: von Willebrand factor type A domain-containing protein [Chryseosolibacter sp.]|nr:von Willebrand factor type A domain-containing protein [Chryseosolibacter sp.]